MSLQDILQKVLEDANKKVSELKTKADEEKKSLEKSAEQKLATDMAEMDSKTEAIAQTLAQKTEFMARKQNGQALLSAKQDVIDKALRELYNALVDADDKLYTDVLKALFGPVPNKPAKILAPEKRLALTQKLAPGAAEVIASKKIKGGFIIQYSDAQIDNSLKNLVFSEYKNELVSYFSQQLKFV